MILLPILLIAVTGVCLLAGCLGFMASWADEEATRLHEKRVAERAARQ